MFLFNRWVWWLGKGSGKNQVLIHHWTSRHGQPWLCASSPWDWTSGTRNMGCSQVDHKTSFRYTCPMRGNRTIPWAASWPGTVYCSHVGSPTSTVPVAAVLPPKGWFDAPGQHNLECGNSHVSHPAHGSPVVSSSQWSVTNYTYAASDVTNEIFNTQVT